MRVGFARALSGLGLAAIGAGGALALASCSSEETTSGRSLDSGAPEGGFGADAGTSPLDASAGSLIEANAMVLVHAASFPAFRVCFEGTASELPQPSIDLMPESNVVGVDIGTAVVLPPSRSTLGRAFVFPESVLRPLYPAFGGAGPSCQQLLTAAGTKPFAVEVGSVTSDVSHGVHALVLGGCQAANVDPSGSTERCGPEWTAASGNLTLTTLSLMAYARTGDTQLSVQLVQLSPSLQRRADGRALGLAFGMLEAGAPDPFVEGAVPFGQAVPNPPAVLRYEAADVASYATSGLFVTLGGAIDDAGVPVDAGDGGAREVLVAQSLADIQRRSSPRALPADWFSSASSYVVLSVGDIDPRLGDGGPDSDPRRALHLLALPLATPDAGP